MLKEAINKIEKNRLLIVYKLLNDLLLIGLFFLFFMLVGESLLPGSLSLGMKFPAVIIILLLDLVIIKNLAKQLDIQKETKASKKALWIGALVFSIFILNSLIKLFQFNLFLGIFIFLLILIASYFIYKLAFEN